VRNVRQKRNIKKEIPAGSVFALPASLIGLSEKAGMRERDWNRKGGRERERERKPEREFLWLGTLHRKRRGLSCVYSARRRETSSLRGVMPQICCDSTLSSVHFAAATVFVAIK